MSTKNISAHTIRHAVYHACLDVNVSLPRPVAHALCTASLKEKGRAKRLLGMIQRNAAIAQKTKLALCQDTGIVEVFADIGQDVHIDFCGTPYKTFEDIVHAAVRDAYRDGYFRQSVVTPLTRKNTRTNTPAIVHTRCIRGSRIVLHVAPKGFGCENMGAVAMLNPTASLDDIVAFVVEKVKKAGPNPCPPMFLGIGIGGTMGKAAELAKEALIGIKEQVACTREEKKYIEQLRTDILKKTNALGIGTLGMGGKISVLDVAINTHPTHIAGLPVAIAFSCWCNRYKKIVV